MRESRSQGTLRSIVMEGGFEAAAASVAADAAARDIRTAGPSTATAGLPPLRAAPASTMCVLPLQRERNVCAHSRLCAPRALPPTDGLRSTFTRAPTVPCPPCMESPAARRGLAAWRAPSMLPAAASFQRTRWRTTLPPSRRGLAIGCRVRAGLFRLVCVCPCCRGSFPADFKECSFPPAASRPTLHCGVRSKRPAAGLRPPPRRLARLTTAERQRS